MRCTVPMPTGAPRSVNWAWISTKVMSRCSTISLLVKSPCASILAEWRSPPRGLATALPWWSAMRRQRIALEVLTPKCVAAARQLIPPSIAATTRSRRSCESVRAIRAGFLPLAGSVNQNRARKGIPTESERRENAVICCDQGKAHFFLWAKSILRSPKTKMRPIAVGSPIVLFATFRLSERSNAARRGSAIAPRGDRTKMES